MASSGQFAYSSTSKDKAAAKYNDEIASECLEWIKTVLEEDLDTSGHPENFHKVLKDGQVLCRLANRVKPGSIKKVNTSTMAFKCMENISYFLKVAVECGVPSTELFQTVDLWEKHNLNQVVVCLQSLGRKGAHFGCPSIGPKEADKNVRHFTEEQLRAGQGVTRLQMGSNKGASQSGIVFGGSRHM